MRKRTHQSLFLIILVLGIGLPGLIGIFVVQAQNADREPELFNSFFQNGSTPSPTITATPLLSLTPAGLPLNGTVSPFGVSPVDIFAFIQAPNGYVERPYVILTAFASIARSESAAIRGFVDTTEFICADSPCAVYLDQGSARIIFRAYTSTGESGEEVISSVNVTSDAQGYLVAIDSVSQFESFVDSCSLVWGVRDEENASWDSFVQFPYQINTKKTLHTLSRNLILNGIVDTSNCPAGGLSVGLDWPTTCGLEASASKMIEWQNQFDEYIWLAGKEQGIPPKILKTLIEVESQFWPGNSRFYLDEIGLGQINQLGVDVLLRKDPSLYRDVCSTVLSDCALPYTSLDPTQQALIRGAVVKSADATCPTCENGLDLDVAKDSISLVAKLLQANCQQVDEVLGNKIADADYEDLWRFTLAAYHSGVSCFIDAVNTLKDANKDITWENLENELSCGKGADYVNGVMDNLFAFDFYLYQAVDKDRNLTESSVVATRTPVPTPTAYVSSAVVKVQAYTDINGNGVPDEPEWIDGMSVELMVSSDTLSKRTENGVALFDLSGYRPGLDVTIQLPGLYRTEYVVLPETGEVVVTFKFDQPTLPTKLP